MAGLFDTNITLLQKAMDFRAQRNVVLASNVANIETPGFQAKDLVFENALSDALRAREPGPLRVTNARHLDGRSATPLELVQPQFIHSGNPVATKDGNSVDLEREMAKLGENQIGFQALTQMISHKFMLLKTVIREGEM
ncbi:MAG: flagellar basal body rod protein FlgB [Candidatus Lambdaproteobacteria bacterium]|nr:flagellar basal body rod protein FlgB [Candidatus Lambdaproteobacteria bacterium]